MTRLKDIRDFSKASPLNAALSKKRIPRSPFIQLLEFHYAERHCSVVFGLCVTLAAIVL